MSQRKTNQENSKSPDQTELQFGNTSGAFFYLLNSEDSSNLRKKIFKKKEKLKMQYTWLKNHNSFEFIPKVSNPLEDSESFSYDMPYYKEAVTAYAYFKKSSDLELFQSILKKVEGLRNDSTPITEEQITKYLSEKLTDKLALCLKDDSSLSAYYSNSFSVGKTECLGIDQLIKELVSKAQLLAGGENYDIHGDLTFENILITPDKKIIFIDPNDDNHISSREVELGKVFQSLNSFYEGLSCGEVKVDDLPLVNQTPLFQSLQGYIIENYGNRSLQQVYFHEVIHLARLLPYKQKKQPEKFLEFLKTFAVRGTLLLRMIESE